jgi:hypothetical protein
LKALELKSTLVLSTDVVEAILCGPPSPKLNNFEYNNEVFLVGSYGFDVDNCHYILAFIVNMNDKEFCLMYPYKSINKNELDKYLDNFKKWLDNTNLDKKDNKPWEHRYIDPPIKIISNNGIIVCKFIKQIVENWFNKSTDYSIVEFESYSEFRKEIAKTIINSIK